VNLDRRSEDAVRRHDIYFHDHLLKMVLGNCVRLLGVRETRRLVLRYARQLKWF
jgi:hypothetical protein